MKFKISKPMFLIMCSEILGVEKNKEIAEKLGYDEYYFSKVINNKVPVTPNFAVKVSSMLNCKIDKIFSIEEEK